MPTRSMLRFALIPWVLVALFAGCQRESPAPANAPGDPMAVIEAGVAALRAGDLKAFYESQLPPAEIERLRAGRHAPADEPIDEAARARFDRWLADLRAPDAEDRILAALEPELARFEREIEPQLARNVAMLKGLALVAIQQSEELTPLAKQQAMASLDAIASWIATTRFSDRARLREALGHLAAAAREADVPSLEALESLDWDAATERWSIAFRGAKRALEAYGLGLDAILDSVATELVSQQGDRARVLVRYTMLGQPMSFEVDLVARDGRWYVKDTLEAAERAAATAAAAGG